MKMLLKEIGTSLFKLVMGCIAFGIGVIVAAPFAAYTWKIAKFIFLTINP